MAQAPDASLRGAHDGSPGSAYESGAALALCAVALGAFFLHAHFLARQPVDDAGISVAYARSFVEGYGFRVTQESAVAEGYSNVSWTAILIVLEALGRDSLTFVRPLGLAFAALALPLIMMWGPIAESRRLRVEDALGPLIAAAHPSFVHWAQGGLEMGLQVFGIALLAALGLSPSPSSRRGVAFGAAAALVALTRPEGPLYVLAAGSSWVMRMIADRRRPGRVDVGALLAGALPLVLYLAFRRSYFGEWLPNTYFAKSRWDFDGRLYLLGFFTSYRPLCVASLCALPFAWIGGYGAALRGLCNTLIIAALTYFAYHAKGDWMKEWRFLAVLAPFLGAALAAGISGARQALARASASPLLHDPERAGPAPHVQRALLILGLMPSAWAGYKLLPSELERSEPVRAGGSDVPITIAKGTPFEPIATLLAPLKMTHPLVIASDMGAIALGMRKAELWDFAGLTDPAVARHFNEAAAMEDYLEHEGPPTLALAWGPGSFFPTLRLTGERYDLVGPGQYWLRGLTAEEDPRCPDGKRAVIAMSPQQLSEAIATDASRGEPLRALARWRCAHTYLEGRALPRWSQRKKLGQLGRELAERSKAAGKLELALRFYSLCAVVAVHDTRLSVHCRKQAEPIRTAIFPPPAPAVPKLP